MTDVVVEDVVVMPLPFLRTMDIDMGHDDDAGDEGEGGEEHEDGNILVDEMDVDVNIAAADMPVVVVDAAAAVLLPAAAVVAVVVAAVSSE
jgi:hypothetical protein